mgnify:CR=1 FL=1
MKTMRCALCRACSSVDPPNPRCITGVGAMSLAKLLQRGHVGYDTLAQAGEEFYEVRALLLRLGRRAPSLISATRADSGNMKQTYQQ